MSPLIWIMPAIMSGLFFVYRRRDGTGTTVLPHQGAIFSCVTGNGTRWEWDSVAMGLGRFAARKAELLRPAGVIPFAIFRFC